MHQAQIEQRKAQNAAVHLQVETQAEIDPARIRPVSTPGWRRSIHVWGRNRRPEVAAFVSAGRAINEERSSHVADLKRLSKYLTMIHHA